MATKTRVKQRALELLGRKRLLQSSQSQDNDRMEEAWDEVYEQLKTASLNVFVTAGPVPDEIVPHVVSLMAFNAIDDYGVSQKRYARILARYNIAEREIRRLTTENYESLDEASNY